MSLWGKSDLVAGTGTVAINLNTGVIIGSGTTFVTSGVAAGDVITVGTGGTYGQAVISSVTSNTVAAIASTQFFAVGLTTVPAGAQYFISERPVYTLNDSNYTAAQIFGVDVAEVGVALTTNYAVAHSGWVGIKTYTDMHGNPRVKSEVLVAIGVTSDAADDSFGPFVFKP